MERAPDRLARRWVPVTTVEARELLEAYQQLPDRTAAARVAVTAVTSPEPQGTSAPVHLRLSHSTAVLLTAGVGTRSRTGDAVPGPEQTLAGRRWQRTCEASDPRLLADPHWPALAGALDRVELAGVDETRPSAQPPPKPRHQSFGRAASASHSPPGSPAREVALSPRR